MRMEDKELNWVKTVFGKAKKFIENGMYNEARHQLDLILRKYPDDKYALIEMGRLEALTNWPDKALEYFKKLFGTQYEDNAKMEIVYLYIGERAYQKAYEVLLQINSKELRKHKKLALLYLSKRLGNSYQAIANKNESDSTYLEKQIIKYNEEEALNRTLGHTGNLHSNDEFSIFDDGIDVATLFHTIELDEKGKYRDRCLDIYRIRFPNAGVDRGGVIANHIVVATIANTRQIVSMHPVAIPEISPDEKDELEEETIEYVIGTSVNTRQIVSMHPVAIPGISPDEEDELEEETIEYVIETSVELERKRMYVDALYQLYLVLTFYPQNLSALLKMGQLEKKLHNYAKAKDCFNALFDTEMEAFALFELGEICYIKKEYEQSREYLESLLRTYQNLNAIMLLIMIDIAEKKYADAYSRTHELKGQLKKQKKDSSDLDLILLFLSKELGITNESGINKKLSYTERQLISYNPKKALKHILKHKILLPNKQCHGIFNVNVDVINLFETVKLDEENKNSAGVVDQYLVRFEDIGVDKYGDKTDYMLVVTIANTGQILTMYPINPDNMGLSDARDLFEDKKWQQKVRGRHIPRYKGTSYYQKKQGE